MSKPTTPEDIVEAIKFIIHGCDRSKPDVIIPAASQPIVGKYICEQFITPLREEITQLEEDKMHLEGQLSYLMWAPTEGGRRKPAQSNLSLLEEIAQLNIDKQNLTLQIAYLSHVRLDDWSRSNPIRSNPPPAVPPSIVKFEVDGVQWYPYTASSEMPGMSYHTTFPVCVLYKDKTNQTLKQVKYPDGLMMGTKPGQEIIGYRFINESDDPYYNTSIKTDKTVFFDTLAALSAITNGVLQTQTTNTVTPNITLVMPADKDRITLAKWVAGNDTGISSKAMAAVYLAGTDVFDKGTDNTPRDAPDLGRCIRLVALCPDIVNVAFPILRTMHPVWSAYINNWQELKTVHSLGDYHKTTKLMDDLRAGVLLKDPLQYIKDALKAGRQVQQLDHKDSQWYHTLDTKNIYADKHDAWYNNPDNYRILLNHTDIKPTTVFRNKGVTIGYVVLSEVTEEGVYFSNNNQIVPWSTLAKYSEYSHDGVMWQPCYVLPQLAPDKKKTSK